MTGFSNSFDPYLVVDRGLTLNFLAILSLISKTTLSGDAVVDLSKIIQVVENTMDGTSGALYAIFLNSVAHSLRQQSSAGQATVKVWATALKQASESLSRYTPAQPGDRTLVDAYVYPTCLADMSY